MRRIHCRCIESQWDSKGYTTECVFLKILLSIRVKLSNLHNIKFNKIGSEGAALLAEALKTNDALEFLGLNVFPQLICLQ